MDCNLFTVQSLDEEREKPALNVPMPYEQSKHFLGNWSWSLRQTGTAGSSTSVAKEYPEPNLAFKLKPKQAEHEKG